MCGCVWVFNDYNIGGNKQKRLTEELGYPSLILNKSLTAVTPFKG